MKKFQICLIISLLSALSANSTFALDLSKLCGDFTFMKSPDVKVYRGSYENGVLEHALVLVEVTSSNDAIALYVHGTQPEWGIENSDCSPSFGKMKGRKLILQLQPWIKVEYKFDKSDGAKIKYIFTNRDGGKRITRGFVKLAEQ